MDNKVIDIEAGKGTVNVLRGLDAEKEIHFFTGRLRDNLDLNWEHCKIFMGDKELSPDYEVTADDVITVREYPGVATTLGAGLLVAGVIGVIIGGVVAYDHFVLQPIRQAEREMREALERMGRNNANRDVQSIPHLSGARNEFAEGKQAPIFLGKHLFAPYFLSEPYLLPSGTDGEDLYWYGTFLVGQTGLALEKLRNGQIDLVTFPNPLVAESIRRNFNTTHAGFNEHGNFAEVIQSGYFSDNVFNERWVDSLDSSVELGRIRKDNAQTIGDPPLFIEDDGPEIIIRESARFPMRLEIEIFVDGLHGWDSYNGVPVNARVAVVVEWSRNENGPWTRINMPAGWSNSATESALTRNSMRQMRFIASVNLPASVYTREGEPVFIRAQRTNNNHVGGFRSRTMLTSIRTRQYNPHESSTSNLVAAKNIALSLADKFCRIGIRLKVNENTQEALDRFNVIASMTGRTWNGTQWGWEKTATSNPAAVALEVLTGLIHEPSRHRDGEIDMVSLGRLYEWCNSREVRVAGSGQRPLKLETCGVLTGTVRKLDVLQSILAACDAGMYVNETGRLTFWFDDFQSVPVGLLNPQRIVSMTESRDFNRRTDGYAVAFIDRNSDWSERTERVLRPRVEFVQGMNTYDSFNPDYITDYYHAMWLARRVMARQILQPGETVVEVGREGAFYTPGSLLKVQHEGFRIGISSGEIAGPIVEDGMVIGLRTMERHELRWDRDYWIEWYVVDEGNVDKQARNHVVSRNLRRSDDFTDRLLFTIPQPVGNPAPIPVGGHDAPVLGNILSVIDGERAGTPRLWESRRYVVMDASRTASGYELRLAPYDSVIYETTQIDEIPAFQGRIPSPPREGGYTPPPSNPADGLLRPQDLPPMIGSLSPRYRGAVSIADLENTGTVAGMRMNIGDWVMFIGNDVGIWLYAHIMRWDGTKWTRIPRPSEAPSMFWMYLAGISDLTEGAPEGVFSDVFAGAIAASRAFITELYKENAVLRDGGVIQSENFLQGQEGFRIRANGNAEFNNIAVNNGFFRGQVEADSGTMENITARNVDMQGGRISIGNLYVSESNPVPRRELPASATIWDLYRFIGTVPSILPNGGTIDGRFFTRFTRSREAIGGSNTIYHIRAFNNNTLVWERRTQNTTTPNNARVIINAFDFGTLLRLIDIPIAPSAGEIASMPPGTVFASAGSGANPIWRELRIRM